MVILVAATTTVISRASAAVAGLAVWLVLACPSPSILSSVVSGSNGRVALVNPVSWVASANPVSWAASANPESWVASEDPEAWVTLAGPEAWVASADQVTWVASAGLVAPKMKFQKKGEACGLGLP